VTNSYPHPEQLFAQILERIARVGPARASG
jgi:hypothetical protein